MEGEADTIEPFYEWQQVKFETVSTKNEISVFPPSNHEGLQIPSQCSPPIPTQPIETQVLPEPTECNANGEKKELMSDSEPEPKAGGNTSEMRKRLKLKIEILRCWIVRIASKDYVRRGFWSFGSVSVVVAVLALLCSRIQKWRQWVRENTHNRLILLLKEKDQKINQLLLQIAKLNERLFTWREVPVIRLLD